MIVSWIKDKLGVTELHRKLRVLICENRRLEGSIESLHKEIHAMDKIDIDVDLGKRGRNTIILTGCYKGRGYVRFYDLPQDEFIHYVERTEHEKKHNLIRNVDCPPTMKAWFNFKLGAD